jgi:thiosulfate dehydrogenase [quinone] large subunit
MSVTTAPAGTDAHTPIVLRATLRTWGPTVVRLLFGVVFAVDAYLKWQPGYRSSYISQLRVTAHSQPAFLHGWFHFWIQLNQASPALFADLTGITETFLAAVLLLGVARRAGYLVGAGYMLLVWSVGEGFGGPYASGSTDVGTGIMYVLLFLALLVYAPAASAERLSLDRLLVRRAGWWRLVAEPHGADRAG